MPPGERDDRLVARFGGHADAVVEAVVDIGRGRVAGAGITEQPAMAVIGRCDRLACRAGLAQHIAARGIGDGRSFGYCHRNSPL